MWIEFGPNVSKLFRFVFAIVHAQMPVIAVFQYKLPSDHLYDMGVEDVWHEGFWGEGVLVAVVDVGVQMDHKDLQINMVKEMSYNLINRIEDANPWNWKSYRDRIEDFTHGTKCAGVIGAIKDNRFCSRGVAPNVRMTSLVIMDAETHHGLQTRSDVIAKALTYKNDRIEIYSNSWGESDFGCSYSGLGQLVVSALDAGVRNGRNGKGSIFVFASGNGGRGDNCNADGYANSIHTLTISSVGTKGNIPNFAEPCPCVLASTYGEGSRFNYTYLTTTTLDNNCTDHFTGTSASAAIASGIIALTLQANPDLSKRDIEHIIVETAKTEELTSDADWITNGASFRISPYFGFGLMDADAMINLAIGRKAVSEQHECIVAPDRGLRRDPGDSRTVGIMSHACYGTNLEVQKLEHVQTSITLAYQNLDDLELWLVSPSGTKVPLVTKRPSRCRRNNDKLEWMFSTIFFWGENPTGLWTLQMNEGTEVLDIVLRLYGTSITAESHSGENGIGKVITSGVKAGIGIGIGCVAALLLIILVVVILYKSLPLSLQTDCKTHMRTLTSYVHGWNFRHWNFRPMRHELEEVFRILCRRNNQSADIQLDTFAQR